MADTGYKAMVTTALIECLSPNSRLTQGTKAMVTTALIECLSPDSRLTQGTKQWLPQH